MEIAMRQRDELREALSSLVRSEALLVESQAIRDREVSALRREMADFRRSTEERFSRIEAILLRLVEVLPEAVRERIGIKPEPQT